MPILKLLKDHYATMSAGKKLIADFINENMNIAAYCTASEMAQRVGVSNAQIVKFVKEIDLESYKKMQTMIRDEQENHVSMTSQLLEWKKSDSGDIKENCKRVLERDVFNIQQTVAAIPIEMLESIAREIVKAKRVAFIGARGAAGCNTIPATFMGQMRENVHLITPGLSTSIDKLSWWGEEDLLIGISTYSYGSGFAPELLNLGKKNGCKTVLFTDSETFMQTPDLGFDYTVQFATKNVLISYSSLLAVFNILSYLVSTMIETSAQAIEETERRLQLSISRKDNPENYLI